MRFHISKRLGLILLVSVFIVAIIAVAIWQIAFNVGKQKSIEISNFPVYVRNLPDSERDKIQAALYETVMLNRAVDDRVVSIENAVIRIGSYKQIFDESSVVFITSFIVDMESIEQSYVIKNYYLTNSQYDESEDYTVQVMCLDADKLIYGDFDCIDRFVIESGAKRFDPILSLLPYQTNFYIVEHVGGTGSEKVILRLTIYSMPRFGIENTPESQQKYNQEVRAWMLSNGLRPDDYEITFAG